MLNRTLPQGSLLWLLLLLLRLMLVMPTPLPTLTKSQRRIAQQIEGYLVCYYVLVTALHYIDIALHCVTSRYITLHCIALHYITLQNITEQEQ